MYRLAIGFAAEEGVCWREVEIEHGTRVRLRAEAFGYGRPHLLWHARQGDIGVVSGPSKQSPAMSQLYTIVHFAQCGHDHRLHEDEMEIVTDGVA